MTAEQAKELERLWSLKQAGALSEDEFTALKRQMLDPVPNPERSTAAEQQKPAPSPAQVQRPMAARGAVTDVVSKTSGSGQSELVRKVLNWLWVAFCALMAFGSALQGHVLGTLLLAIAVIFVLAPLWRETSLARLNLSPGLRAVGSGVAFVTAMLLSPASPDAQVSSNSETAPTRQTR